MQYEKEAEAGHVALQTKFNYAWGLVKSPKHEHQAFGVKLLQGTLMCREEAFPVLRHHRFTRFVRQLSSTNSSPVHILELYREEPTRRRECLYYLALGYYKMGNYEEAKRFNGKND